MNPLIKHEGHMNKATLTLTALLALGISGAASAKTYLVNDLGDTAGDMTTCTAVQDGGDPSCTLRQAVNAANSDATLDTILFDVVGTIEVVDKLVVSSHTIIDACDDSDSVGSTSNDSSCAHDVTIMDNRDLSTLPIDPFLIDEQTFQFGPGSDGTNTDPSVVRGLVFDTNSDLIFAPPMEDPIGAIEGIEIYDTSNILIEHNIFRNKFLGGVSMRDDFRTPTVEYANNITVQHNVFESNFLFGILSESSSNIMTVRENHFTGNGGVGVFLINGGLRTNQTIENNFFGTLETTSPYDRTFIYQLGQGQDSPIQIIDVGGPSYQSVHIVDNVFAGSSQDSGLSLQFGPDSSDINVKDNLINVNADGTRMDPAVLGYGSFEGAFAINLESGKDVRVENNDIAYTAAPGVFQIQLTSDSTVIDNRIFANGDENIPSDGISVLGGNSNLEILYNTIDGNSDTGIYVSTLEFYSAELNFETFEFDTTFDAFSPINGVAPGDVLIKRNTITNSGLGGIFVGGDYSEAAAADLATSEITVFEGSPFETVVDNLEDILAPDIDEYLTKDGTTRDITITENSISNNGLLGIDLAANNSFQRPLFVNFDTEIIILYVGGEDGITPNDNGDGDDGANNLQNFPKVKKAVYKDGQIKIDFKLKSEPGKDYAIHFYLNSENDREGEIYVDPMTVNPVTVTTDGNGKAKDKIWLPIPAGAMEGMYMTATATPIKATGELSGTSEFSKPRRVKGKLEDDDDSSSSDSQDNSRSSSSQSNSIDH